MAAVTAAHAAFLTARRSYIGGTDIAAITGVSPWASPLSVYLDKTAPEQAERSDNLPMRRGLALERFIADEFELAHPRRRLLPPAPDRAHRLGLPRRRLRRPLRRPGRAPANAGRGARVQDRLRLPERAAVERGRGRAARLLLRAGAVVPRRDRARPRLRRRRHRPREADHHPDRRRPARAGAPHRRRPRVLAASTSSAASRRRPRAPTPTARR